MLQPISRRSIATHAQLKEIFMRMLPVAIMIVVLWADAALAQPQCAYVESDVIAGDTTFIGDQTGTAVDFSGETLVIGAPSADSGRGAAYVYELDASGDWVQTAKLSASDGSPPDFFGSSVGIGTDRIVVGAPQAGDGLIGEGAIYLFDRQPGGSWLEVVRATGNDSALFDSFGTAVDISPDDLTVVVGAPNYDILQPQLETDAGAVYIFAQDSTSGAWTESQLLASNATQGLSMGYSLSMDGNVLVAGSRDTGTAYVFEGSSGAWSETAILVPSGPSSLFSRALAVSGTTIVGGNATDDVYVFENQVGVWTETQRISYAYGTSIRALAIEGERIAISVSNVPAAQFNIEIHDRPPGGSWSKSFDLTQSQVSSSPSSPANSLEIASDYIFAGDISEDSVFVFPNPTGQFWACPSTPSASLGDTITLTIDAGASAAGSGYWILGSVSGTVPGFDLDGINVPLNPDDYLTLTANATASPIVNGVGALDSNGQATAQIVVAPDPSLAGGTVHHAFVLFDIATLEVTQASEAIATQFLP